MIELIKDKEECFLRNEKNDIKGIGSPVGNCGLFGIKYFGTLRNGDTTDFLKNVDVFYQIFGKRQCLLNDNYTDFNKYKKEIEDFIFWESTPYINYNSSQECLFFILDCEKIHNYLELKNLSEEYKIL